MCVVCMSHWLIYVFLKNLYAFLYFIGLKLTYYSVKFLSCKRAIFLYFECDQNIYFCYDGCEDILFIFYNVWCLRFLVHFLGILLYKYIFTFQHFNFSWELKIGLYYVIWPYIILDLKLQRKIIIQRGVPPL